MGIQQNTGGGGTIRRFYNYNLKSGSLIESVRPAEEGGKWGKNDHGNVRIDGRLAGVYLKEDEFDGKKRAAVVAVLMDDAQGVEQHVGVSCWSEEHETSSAAIRFMGRLNACAVNDSVVLQCSITKPGDTLGNGEAAKNAMTNMIIYRPVFAKGNSVAPVFSDGTATAPKAKYVKVGNKEVPDKTVLNQELEALGASLIAKFPYDAKHGVAPLADAGHEDEPDLVGATHGDVAGAAANEAHPRQRAA